MMFRIVTKDEEPDPIEDGAKLISFDWDDYSFKTLFSLTVFENGEEHFIGNVKIGFVGQEYGWTKEHLDSPFDSLKDSFFSLGQDVSYYQNLVTKLSPEMIETILGGLRDIVRSPAQLPKIEKEASFKHSLLRIVKILTLQQFRRVLRREATLTGYNFTYKKEASKQCSAIEVKFDVVPNASPPSNMHVLIGRNGVGKTTLLTDIVESVLRPREDTGSVIFSDSVTTLERGFSCLVFVSFSAFDRFEPPEGDENGRCFGVHGMQFYYIGLKSDTTPSRLKTRLELYTELTCSLEVCFAQSASVARWIEAVTKLESDNNFAAMDLLSLVNVSRYEENDRFREVIKTLFGRMSSGHAIVLLTITRLIETVNERTLVLLDEPESHLHPPLLSAFTRALSDLLVNRNAVAIVATHSPVLLQEVPRSCVSVMRRFGQELRVDRPENETFGENVGMLTRDVFGLEVAKSGFHDLLQTSVSKGGSYESIQSDYNSQIGFEGLAILRSLIRSRDSKKAIE